MRVLVVGAGVIGSVYAGGFAQAGHEVVLLARGKRLDDLRRAGLQLQRWGADLVRPKVDIASIPPQGRIDLTIVALRRDQALEFARHAPNVPGDTLMLFGNNAGLIPELAACYGIERVVAGFPGVGGRVGADMVTYTMIKQQPTVVGAVSGGSAGKLRVAIDGLRSASFHTDIERDIEGWLGSHAALVVPMAAAITACGGAASALARRKDVLRLAVRTTSVIYKAQLGHGCLTINANLRMLYLRLPHSFAVWYWSRALRGEFGELAFAAHTRHAWREMAALGAWLRTTLDDDHAAALSLDRIVGLAEAATAESTVL